MVYPYSGPKLLELLEKQHQARSQQKHLFQQGTFTLNWRTKVGSFPHPDLETLVSAGEPCGAWRPASGTPTAITRPEAKRNVGENWSYWQELPLNGYVPGASIRGVVRAWAMQYPDLRPQVRELLGEQTARQITAGKIEFLDAFPQEPTPLTLDIVNPQWKFQVFHEGQSTPLSLYTLGDGEDMVPLQVAIRGIPGKATVEDVATVWAWVQQALNAQGVGSRTASGYGRLKTPSGFQSSKLPEGYSSKVLSFILYSQGSAGPNIKTPELRPSHWRGWLRSWLLRFFLGVMPVANAQLVVSELLGTLEEGVNNSHCKGLIRLQMNRGSAWGEESEEGRFQRFYKWQGSIKLTAPTEILNKVVLPVLRVAVRVGGVGRGWRRPLHKFVMKNEQEAARGSHLLITHKIKNPATQEMETKAFGVSLQKNAFGKLYEDWKVFIRQRWSDLYSVQHQVDAEVFSPTSCAIYRVNGPDSDPIDTESLSWAVSRTVATRGDGMKQIYKPVYKGKPEVGGAAGAGTAHCSWVSIRRIKQSPEQFDEVVCIFMGKPNSLRRSFLKELAQLDDAVHLFGCTPT